MLNRRQLLKVSALAAVEYIIGSDMPRSPHEKDQELINRLFPIPPEGELTSKFTSHHYDSELANDAQQEMGKRFYIDQDFSAVNGGSIAFLGGGWGQLIEANGKLLISTIPHVVINGNYRDQITMHIPNYGFVSCESANWFVTKSNGEQDVDNCHYYLPLTEELSSNLGAPIRQGLIAPVRPLPYLPKKRSSWPKNPFEGKAGYLIAEIYNVPGTQPRFSNEAVAMGAVADYSGYTFGLYHGDTTCDWSSGEAYFELDAKGNPTGGVFGSLVNGNVIPGYRCSNDVTIKPYFNFSHSRYSGEVSLVRP